MQKFVDTLDLPAVEKKKLKALTPPYIGLAVKLVDD